MAFIYSQQISICGDPVQPQWLTEQIFADFLKQSMADFKSISKFCVSPVNDTSSSHPVQGWQVRVVMLLQNGKSKVGTYILETPVIDKAVSSSSSTQSLFEREAAMYETIVPAFEELYKNAGKPVKLAAASWKLGNAADPKHVLLNDVKYQGYAGIQRSQMDLNYAKSFLQKLASFHAASVVYADKNRGFPKIFEQAGFKIAEIEQFKRNAQPYDRKFIECLRTYDLREYQDILKTYQDYCSKEFFKCMKLDRSEFNVLLLGQCNSASILYQRDAFGNVKDSILTNFHSCHYGSPAKDLWYFVVTGVKPSDSVQNFDFYVKFYHKNLLDYLNVLGWNREIPKISDLHISMMKHSPFGFNVISKELPLVLTTPDPKEWLLLEEYQRLKSIYENAAFYEEIKTIVPFMYNRGLLEV